MELKSYIEKELIWKNGLAYIPSCLNCKYRANNGCPVRCINGVFADEVCDKFEFKSNTCVKDIENISMICSCDNYE